jgi:protein SCO1/2
MGLAVALIGFGMLVVSATHAFARQELPKANDPAAAADDIAKGEPATTLTTPQIMGTGIEEHLGGQLPLDAEFVDADGKTIHLSDYFGKEQNKPAIIAMVYYHCPITCTAVMEKLAQCLNGVDMVIGKDYRVLMFSINHRESTVDAVSLREMYVAGYTRGDDRLTREGWLWHTGRADQNRKLADALGFKYKMLDDGNFSHPVALFMATPDGRVSRYLYGWEYVPRDVKLALMESASGRLTKSIGDRLLAYCYMFDPKAGSYTLMAMRVMQVGGLLTLGALVILVGGLFAWERKRRKARDGRGPTGDAGPPMGGRPTPAAM